MEKKKIKELFEYRKIPYLLDRFDKIDRKWLLKKLILIQARIYDLDTYLESKWELKDKKLDHYWEKIRNEFFILNIKGAEFDDLTNHIRRYQLHESQLREAKLPTRLKLEYYYYYKSCDVRLMRNILFNLSESLSSKMNLADWRYFDLITELNDDIEDVFEDQNTINGNYFLIQAHTSGLDYVTNEFRDGINDFKEKSNKRFEASNQKDLKKINIWTNEVADDTLDLLKKSTKRIKKKGLKQDSGLLKYLNL